MTADPRPDLQRTPLHDQHVALGARMVPFAGYAMPVQYPLGVLREHLWTREKAGLFDVSHMGQAYLEGADAGRLLERLVPADIIDLPVGRTRYTQLLDAEGGILDDLMVTRRTAEDDTECLVLVVNASRKQVDFALLRDSLPQLDLTVIEDRALLALQGPMAAAVVAQMWPSASDMAFMEWRTTESPGCFGMGFYLSRSGYTGEDGFEVSYPIGLDSFLQRLLADPRVQPIGLGARDSLRLEAGLCLYGHDIDETTTPVEAGLAWSIPKRRRLEGGFPGAERIQRELRDGPRRLRVGIRPDGRAPARDGTEILSADGRPIGRVTSGGFSPTLDAPIAMGYVEAAFAAVDTPLQLLVRGKPLPARVAALPFVPHRYVRRITR